MSITLNVEFLTAPEIMTAKLVAENYIPNGIPYKMSSCPTTCNQLAYPWINQETIYRDFVRMPNNKPLKIVRYTLMEICPGYSNNLYDNILVSIKDGWEPFPCITSTKEGDIEKKWQVMVKYE